MILLELFFGMMCSACLGFMLSKVEKIDQKIDSIEIELIIIKQSIPKRKDDT